MTRLAALLKAITLFVLLTASAVFAQQEIDLEDWERVAKRAEEAVAAARASSDAFEVLRADVSAYRDQWLQIENAGNPRLQTLEAQLSALGPVPEEGEEPIEISDRRAELTERIAELRAPLQQAEEAFTRADGLVSEIDSILRTRQADALLKRGTAPINPRIWPSAYDALVSSGQKIISEIRFNWTNADRRAQLINNSPAVVLALVVAFFFLFRAPRFLRSAAEWMQDKTRRGTGVWATLASFLSVFVPVAGFGLLMLAISATRLLGDLGTLVVVLLPIALMTVLVTRWFVSRQFAREPSKYTVNLPAKERVSAGRYANLLAWLLAITVIVRGIAEFDHWSDDAVAVISFPIHAACGFALFRLGKILRKYGQTQGSDPATDDENEAQALTARLARFTGQGALLVGLFGPILSAIGYFNVADATIFPMVDTLAVFAVMLTLQYFVKDVARLLTGDHLDQNKSLVPVFSGAVLILASIPILALIWGARETDLTELWAKFQAGFMLGGTRISPADFFTFIIVFAIGYAATRLLQGGLRSSVLPKTHIDQGGQTAIVSGIGYIGIFLAGLIAVTTAGIDLTALAFVAGALSVGIGFGLQNIVQNFVSGIILLIERPISEGDWIEVNGQHGTVRDISVRSTRIETFDRTDVIVPNGDLVANPVTNYTRGNVLGRLIVDVGVAYGSDTRKVEEILYKIASHHDMVLMNPTPFVHFKGFGADSLDFDVRMILRDVTQILSVRTEINHQIVEAFAQEGIEIPFAQRDIWLRNPETLTGAQTAAPSTDDRQEPNT